MFENAKWIWNRDTTGTDCYAEFYTACELDGDLPVRFRISSDSNYSVYVNGNYADSGQYADFPHYKIYDEIDISSFVVSGVNHIAVIVWYYGVSSFTYYIGKPGVIFEVEQEGKVVTVSDETVLSRKSRQYISGRNEMITTQLGLNFHVDLKESSEWLLGRGMKTFDNSIVREDMPQKLLPREIKKLVVKPRVISEPVIQGNFSYLPEGEHAGAKMQHAALSFYRIAEMGEWKEDIITLQRKSGEGIFFIVDLQAETSGFVDFDLEVPQDCSMEIGWGEQLLDGRCRTEIAERNFSATVELKRGRNCYMNPFRRLGGRYIQFFLHTSEVKIHYAGLRPTIYPVKILKYKSGNFLRDEIYKVCCNTLIQCMHEHYEDCPWREQAYYSLDSRNQMLCGYYAFKEYEFPRAGLKLIAESVREDGLLPICYPTNDKLAIPSFSLSYVLQVAEYYQYTKDRETVEYCFSAVKSVVDTCVGRIDETGLIPNFEETKGYWNFYEWQPYLNGRNKPGKVYDMCLNAMLSYVLDSFCEICKVLECDALSYQRIKETLNESIVKEFYNEKAELFDICRNQTMQTYSVLANALGCLCGAADGVKKDRILQIVMENGSKDDGLEIIPATLSMHTFRYEALLREDKAFYKEPILKEIDKVYFRMLRQGATSFWETEKGDKDFNYAGSLCHGWSAMPVYYYKTLCEEA